MYDDWEEESKESIYDENSREQLLDDDGLSPEEAAFMEGYEDAE